MKTLTKIIFLSLTLMLITGCQSGNQDAVSVETPVQEEPVAVEPTVAPTATPIPEPEPIYETTFQSIDEWDIYITNDDTNYVYEPSPEGLHVEYDSGAYSYEFWAAIQPDVEGNVRIESDIEFVGEVSERVSINLFCQVVDHGRYAFSIMASGYWSIGKYDLTAEQIFTTLDDGKIDKINSGHITVICNDGHLAMILDGHQLGSVRVA